MKKYLELKADSSNGVWIVATDESVDRDGDIVRVDGLNLSNYKENPIVLEVHQWTNPPIGKAVDVVKDGNKVMIKVDFAETDRGKEWKYLVENGYVRTASIGFRVNKMFWKNEFNEIAQLDLQWYEANKDKLTKANRVIWEAELLEVSLVPIPANPNAQVVMASKGFETAYAFKTAKMTEDDNEEILIEFELDEVKNAVPWNAHPKQMKVVEEGEWDGQKADMNLRKWASTDGSGDKDKINWKKYKAGFAWYDANAPENFTSYKLPHHDIVDGEFAVHRRGVIAAMAALLGARGGVDVPAEDKKGIYNHLAGHYKQHFNMEPPEFKQYTLEQALKTFDDELLEEWIKIHTTPNDIKQLIEKYEKELEIKNEKIKQLENIIKQETSMTSTNNGADEQVVEVEGVDDISQLKQLLEKKLIGGK